MRSHACCYFCPLQICCCSYPHENTKFAHHPPYITYYYPIPPPLCSCVSCHLEKELLQALSHCPHQVRILYTNLCLDKNYCFNIGCLLLFLPPPLYICFLSYQNFCINCLACTFRNTLCLQICLQRPHAPT